MLHRTRKNTDFWDPARVRPLAESWSLGASPKAVARAFSERVRQGHGDPCSLSAANKKSP